LIQRRIVEPPRTDLADKPHPPILQGLREGLRYSGRVRGLRLYLLAASCANLFLTALTVSLPFYVEDVLGVSSDWFGYLMASMGLGAVIGGTIAGWFRQPGVLRGSIQMFCILGLSSCTAALAVIRSPFGALAVLLSTWVLVGFHQVALMTLIQKRTPRAMRGRIFGLMSMIRQGLTPIGLGVFGVLIDQLGGEVTGVLFWTGVAGIVTIVSAISHPDYRWFFMGDENEVPCEVEPARPA
jgi:predicted MFS family arabinose efflux permease